MKQKKSASPIPADVQNAVADAVVTDIDPNAPAVPDAVAAQASTPADATPAPATPAIDPAVKALAIRLGLKTNATKAPRQGGSPKAKTLESAMISKAMVNADSQGKFYGFATIDNPNTSVRQKNVVRVKTGSFATSDEARTKLMQEIDKRFTPRDGKPRSESLDDVTQLLKDSGIPVGDNETYFVEKDPVAAEPVPATADAASTI